MTRHELAASLDVPKNEVLLPIAGELRLLRHALLHDGGVLQANQHPRLEVLGQYFKPDAPLIFSHDKMHHIFRLLDRGIAKLTMDTLNIQLPGGNEEVTQVAIPGRPPQ